MAALRHTADHHDRPRLDGRGQLNAPGPGRRDPAQPPALDVRADLDFSVDLGHGPISGRVEGSGSGLRVTTDDATAVWTALASVPELGGDGLPNLAGLLAENGLRVDVVGPEGLVATVGSGPWSLLGRLTSGSGAIRPGEPRAVLALLRGRLGENRRRVALAALAAAGVAFAGATLIRRATR